ncbi:MAG TPA: histidine ammonia-lyase [Casimicrobiaceae bacterium]
MRAIRVGGRRLRIDDVVAVARDDAIVEVDPDVRRRIAAAREVVLRLAQDDTPIYGVNSALGANTGQRLDASDLVEYQRRAIRARAVGVGPRYDRASVRAMLFTRIAGMAAGGSGVSLEVLDALVALVNRRVHPIVPRYGSIGVADLPQLSHLALPLIGEGLAEFEGEILPGAGALHRAGLSPVALGPKDGIALISANAATVARGALVAADATLLARQWLAAVAASCEGFRANSSPLDPRVVLARPAPGQVDVAAQLRALLAGSALLEPGAARRVQDPLSFRVVAQVHGTLEAALANARGQIELELGSAAESPLVLAEDGIMLSNGNFHLPAFALAFDTLAIALAQTTSLAVERVIRFMSPAMTELPLQLTRHGPAHSGFATVQKTLTALWSEIRCRANPGSLDFLPVSDGVEDHATMALGVVERIVEMLERIRYVIAIEMIVAAQAIDLRAIADEQLGAGVRALHAAVRERVPTLEHDRPLGPDIDSIAALLAAGDLPSCSAVPKADQPRSAKHGG